MLCDGILQTEAMGYPAEYFSVAHATYYKRLIGTERARDYNIVFDYILRLGVTPNGVFSAKILFHQLATVGENFSRSNSYLDLRPMQIIDRLAVDPHYVYLVRRDKLRQAISYYRAIQSGIWWEFEGGRRRESPKLPYDHAIISFWVQVMTGWETAWVNELAQLERPLLELDYDDVIADYSGAMAQVHDLLGLPVGPNVSNIRPKLQKQSDGTTDEWVERFKQIESDKSKLLDRALELF
jgi:LPS sulfotransferase NodH